MYGMSGMGYGGMYSPYGGMYSPYGGGMGMPMMMTGPLSNLNQFLFGVQNVIFSLSQAIQIVSMNTQALQQLLDAAMHLLDKAWSTWKDMLLEYERQIPLGRPETEEDRIRRRRVRILRWTLATAASYAVYKLVRRVFAPRPQANQWQALQQQHSNRPYGNYPPLEAGPYSSGYSDFNTMIDPSRATYPQRYG